MLKTRLDGRSEENKTITLIDNDDNVIGSITVANNVKVELEIDTAQHIHISKLNGWKSK